MTSLTITWNDGTTTHVDSMECPVVGAFTYRDEFFWGVSLGDFNMDFARGTFERIEVGVE